MSEPGLERPARAVLRLGIVAGLLHLPFVVWLITGGGAALFGAPDAATPSAAPLGALRSYAALAALVLFAWSRRPTRWPPPARPRIARAVILFGTAAVIAAVGLVAPVVWAVSLPLWVAGSAILAGAESSSDVSAGLRTYAMLILLAAAVFPFERHLGPSLNPLLQLATAHCAAPLISITGLPVHVDALDDPTLVGEHLSVSVTALCAGSQTLLTLFTLGIVIAEVFLKPWDVKLVFVALTPLFGFAGNVLRVVASTHAATRWGQAHGSWNIAHDLIGYVAFAVTYMALFLVARWLRQHRPSTG